MTMDCVMMVSVSSGNVGHEEDDKDNEEVEGQRLAYLFRQAGVGILVVVHGGHVCLLLCRCLGL